MTKQLTTTQIHGKIGEWHDRTDDGQSLHDYLGWTWEQYKTWAETGKIPESEDDDG